MLVRTCAISGPGRVCQETISSHLKTIQNFPSIEPQNTSEVIVSEIGPAPVHNLLTNRKDDTTKAEIIWAAKTANDNYSFRSSDGVGDTFRAMFSNPGRLETFSMSRTKLSYAIGHGIGPVFKEELISDVRASQNPFSLQYDETTQCQVKSKWSCTFHTGHQFTMRCG